MARPDGARTVVALLSPALAAAACAAPEPPAGGGAGGVASPLRAADPVAAAAVSTTPGEPPPLPPPSPASSPPAGMVRVPGGLFRMGSAEGDGLPEERPRHVVALRGYWLQRTEVTVGAYEECVAAGACPPPRDTHPYCNRRHAGRRDHPVNCVSWDDASRYCLWAGGRLPTEAEWEYAARGGAEERRYPWGAEPPQPSHACWDHAGGTCPVAAYPPGAFGLVDMAGNVWEWTSSAFVPYPGESDRGPERVYRGGGWSRRYAKWLRSVLRNRYPPSSWGAHIGLRCARSIPDEPCPPGSRDEGARCAPLPAARCVLEGGLACADVARAHDGDGRGCGPGRSWVHDAGCLPSGDDGAGGAPGETQRAVAAIDEASPGGVEPPLRTPADDADCARHHPGRPHAYRFRGGAFAGREAARRAAGCENRDVAVGVTSACCP